MSHREQPNVTGYRVERDEAGAFIIRNRVGVRVARLMDPDDVDSFLIHEHNLAVEQTEMRRKNEARAALWYREEAEREADRAARREARAVRIAEVDPSIKPWKPPVDWSALVPSEVALRQTQWERARYVFEARTIGGMKINAIAVTLALSASRTQQLFEKGRHRHTLDGFMGSPVSRWQSERGLEDLEKLSRMSAPRARIVPVTLRVPGFLQSKLHGIAESKGQSLNEYIVDKLSEIVSR